MQVPNNQTLQYVTTDIQTLVFIDITTDFATVCIIRKEE